MQLVGLSVVLISSHARILVALQVVIGTSGHYDQTEHETQCCCWQILFDKFSSAVGFSEI